MDAKEGPPSHPQPVLLQPALGLHSLSPLYSLVGVVLSEGCVRHLPSHATLPWQGLEVAKHMPQCLVRAYSPVYSCVAQGAT